MDLRATFESLTRQSHELPQELRSSDAVIEHVDISQYDESYIEFLDTQIRLCPRGTDWNERLKVRRIAMAPYCNRKYISGRVSVGTCEYSVYIDCESQSIFHWETYDQEL